MPRRSDARRSDCCASLLLPDRSRQNVLPVSPRCKRMGCMASDFIDLVYQAGRLTWPGGSARAACGRGGVRTDKREGDGASPEGTFPLIAAYYRPDRIAPPATGLELTALCPGHGWVDDPGDALYNCPVMLPYEARHERMWRDDGLYDLV